MYLKVDKHIIRKTVILDKNREIRITCNTLRYHKNIDDIYNISQRGIEYSYDSSSPLFNQLNASLKKCVFRLVLNVSKQEHFLSPSGRAFHMAGAHTEKALPPVLLSRGMTGFSKNLSAERRFLLGSYNVRRDRM